MCSRRLPNEYRLVFVLEIVIAVRTEELLGLRWLEFRPEEYNWTGISSSDEENSGMDSYVSLCHNQSRLL